ncbi:MAG: hypothetical protein LBH76_01690, partial [Propionibacteriaceae bacterium]|nr:hypothetical protein [Propionibacteriaceae bacterium]
MAAVAAAVVVAAAGIVVTQQTISAPVAEAAPVNGLLANGDYPNEAPPPITTGITRGAFTQAVEVDDQTLYYGLTNRIGRFTTDADGAVTSNVMTELTRTTGYQASADETSTLAVDAGVYTGHPAIYTWDWASRNTVPVGEGGPDPLGDWNPVVRHDAGAPNSAHPASATASAIYFTPKSDKAEGGSLVYNYWSGGEVIQKTGQLFFSGGECNRLNGTFRMMVFDPRTNRYMTSGKILPLSPSDDIFGSGDTLSCGGLGYVASDMALDGYGNAYLVVRGDAPATSQWAPVNGNGQRVSVGRHYLVRVVPGSDKQGWTYNVVTMLRYGEDGSGDVRGFFGANPAGAAGSPWIYGSAFLNGTLYVNTSSDLTAYNPAAGTVVHVPKGLNTDTADVVRDLASAQTAYVVAGRVVNDKSGAATNGAGTGLADIDAATGVAGLEVALYSTAADGSWRLEGVRQTDGSGNYSFIVGGAGTYHVRLVQPQLEVAAGQPVNAQLTYASAGSNQDVKGRTNRVVARCFDHSVGAVVDRTTSGLCAGAQAAPAADPALDALGSSLAAGSAAIYSTVVLESPDDIPAADFAIAAPGSFGDAGVEPTSMSTGSGVNAVAGGGAPVHVSAAYWAEPGQTLSADQAAWADEQRRWLGEAPVWLGERLGRYDGPASDNTAHNASDDGVWLQMAGGLRAPLEGQVFVAGGNYTVGAKVNGPMAGSNQTTVRGWTTTAVSATGPGVWATSPTWTPAVDANGAAAGPWSPSTTTSVTAVARANFRVAAQTAVAAPTRPDNAAGEYQAIKGGASATPGQPWTSPGEIEDYRYQVADSVYRVVASAVGGSGAFTVDGTPMTLSPGSPTVGLGKAVAAGSAKTVTATAPGDGWELVSVVVRDTFTGAEVARPTVTANGRDSAFSFTAVSQADVTLEVTFYRTPDFAQSTLTVSPLDAASGEAVTTAGADFTLQAYVQDFDGAPMEGQTVRFASASSAVSLRDAAGAATTCTTNAGGTCSLLATATAADRYVDVVSAEVESSPGTWQALSGSPATLEFVSGPPSAATSSLSLDRDDLLITETATATFTLKDGYGNPVAGLKSVGIGLVGQSPTVAAEAGRGVYTAAVGSAAAGGFTVRAQSGGVTLTTPITFRMPAASDVDLTVTPHQPLVSTASGATASARVTVKAGSMLLPHLEEADFTWSSAPAGVAVTAGSFINNGNGTYDVLIHAEQAGEYTLTATVQNQSAAATVVFRALPPTAANTHFNISPAVAYMGQTAEATLSLSDRFGNPVDIDLSAITLTTPADVTQPVAPVKETDASGRATGIYKYTLTASQAGTYVVTAAVDDENGHPVNRQATARWIFAATSSVKLTVAPLSHVVSTAAAAGVVATVQVTDSNGFPVNNLTEAEL